MTDLEELTALLDKWGVPYETRSAYGGSAIEIVNDRTRPRVSGYSGFYTEFKFTVDGSFEFIGAWE